MNPSERPFHIPNRHVYTLNLKVLIKHENHIKTEFLKPYRTFFLGATNTRRTKSGHIVLLKLSY